MADAISPPTTADELAAYLAEQAQHHWNETGLPWLLSAIPARLSTLGVNYRDILLTQRLKEFVAERSGRDFKLVAHPTQSAKLGLVPADVDFTFVEEEASAGSDQVKTSQPAASRSRAAYATTKFLQALAELEPEDAARVIIPTDILVKLLNKK